MIDPKLEELGNFLKTQVNILNQISEKISRKKDIELNKIIKCPHCGEAMWKTFEIKNGLTSFARAHCDKPNCNKSFVVQYFADICGLNYYMECKQ